MHIDLGIVVASAVVGVLVGMTGAGGGALMTPMLTLLFGVAPASAIASDLVASVLMRPVGSWVHLRAGTVNRRMVLLLSIGSVPAALLGTWLLSVFNHQASATALLETVLGVALVVAAAAMTLRYVIDRRNARTGNRRRSQLAGEEIRRLQVRPLPTLAIGALGGLMVGMTSVGAGSLMIVLLLFVYPALTARELVGTDLTQAVPLTLAAAAGSVVFGTVALWLTVSLVLGSVPGVFVGALLSSRVSDRRIRPLIALAMLGSGLRYVGVGPVILGWGALGVVLAGTIGYAVARVRRGSRAEPQPDATGV